MSTPGRNDPCPCGSGKKYKQCHLKNSGKTWSEVAGEVEFSHYHRAAIHQTYFLLNDDFRKHPNPGACHLLSSIMYVLFSEQGISSELCIGEVRRPDGQFFDHSWVEVDGKVFDLSIQLTLDGGRNAPVFAGYDLDTGFQTKFNYRFKSDGLGLVAERVFRTPFSDYLDGADHARSWGLIEAVGKPLGLNLTTAELRDRYKDTKRVLITP
ncbi:SEC-C metal-binding domain-containing protein [Paenibacillus rubinfantis]|uniref:SEC-C metal-binding domain-containing protein n=1 Tax=Paenibacillus rubinfantis TaxID=1720296 RepID=UPI00073ED4F6|nr:SEC-C metal-binding domain-containing protein [Paenibacillus rubinfantis]